MKKEYKELFDNIKPDSELMYDTFNKADENKKSTVFMPRKIVAAALVMAVLAVGSSVHWPITGRGRCLTTWI